MNDRMQSENNENSVIYRIRQLRMKCWFFKPSFIYTNRQKWHGERMEVVDVHVLVSFGSGCMKDFK